MNRYFKAPVSTLTNDLDFIEETARAILREHLGWSGSDERNPSERAGYALCEAQDSYVIAHQGEYEDFAATHAPFGEDDYADMLRENFDEIVAPKAKAKADERWAAAMLLLGVE